MFERWLGRTVCTVALVAMVAAVHVPAHAGWPRPAEGESASGAPELIITFDDGPHERWTPAILDTLRERRVGAVFFWVGHRIRGESDAAKRRRAVVDRAITEGQIVANHTINHRHLCEGGLSPDALRAEIADNESMYEDLARMPVRWFRVPYGDRCQRLIDVMDELGLAHLHWDIDPQEWRDHSSRRVVHSVTRRLAQLDGRAVLILHDTHRVSVKALPEILDWIDEFNAKRIERGERPIRIVSGSELARERLAPGLDSWLRARAEQSLAITSRIGSLIPAPPAEISRY